MVQRSLDGVFVPSTPQPRPPASPVPLSPGAPKVKPLAHLAPYVPKVPNPPVTYLRPTHGEPRPPVVNDGMIKPAGAPALAPAPIMPRPVPVPARVTQRPQPMPAAAAVRQPRKPPKASKGNRLFNLAQYPVLAIVALLAAHSTTIGQWFVLAYAVYALIRRVPSQASFGMALFLLVSIPVFQLLHQAGIAQNIAVYVYELLVVGTMQAVIELYKSRHKKVPQA